MVVLARAAVFFIEPDKIVTNIHVVNDPIIVFAVGTKNVYNIEGVIGSDSEYDLVILQVSGKGEPLPLGKGRINEEIFAVGYPGGGYEITSGTIHNIRAKELSLTSDNGGTVLPQGISGGPCAQPQGRSYRGCQGI